MDAKKVWPGGTEYPGLELRRETWAGRKHAVDIMGVYVIFREEDEHKEYRRRPWTDLGEGGRCVSEEKKATGK